MFRNVQIGDKVWSLRHGWGEVASRHSEVFYINFKTVSHSYHYDGRYCASDLNPTLFWDEVTLKAPTKPIKQVRVRGWVAGFLDRDQYGEPKFNLGFLSAIIPRKVYKNQVSFQVEGFLEPVEDSTNE